MRTSRLVFLAKNFLCGYIKEYETGGAHGTYVGDKCMQAFGRKNLGKVTIWENLALVWG